MKNKIFYNLLFIGLIFLSSNLNAQPNILRGHLIDHTTGEKISNAIMYIQGGDREHTSSDGEFALNLDVGGFFKVGEKVEIIINDDKYGFHTVGLVVPKSLRCTIGIVPNIKFGITGVVQDRLTLEPVKGIEVSAHPANNNDFIQPLPITKTDQFGRFFLVFTKEQLGNTRNAYFYFKDSNNCYSFQKINRSVDAYVEVFLINANCKSKERDPPKNDPRLPGSEEESSENSVLVVDSTSSIELILGGNDKENIQGGSTIYLNGKNPKFDLSKKYWLGILNESSDLFRPLLEVRGENFKCKIKTPENIELLNVPKTKLLLVEVSKKDNLKLVAWRNKNGYDTIVKRSNFLEKFIVITASKIFITKNH